MIWRKSSFSGNGGSCVEVAWRKSTFSANGSECVEVSWPVEGVAVRDSKNTGGATMAFPMSEWRDFLVNLSR